MPKDNGLSKPLALALKNISVLFFIVHFKSDIFPLYLPSSPSSPSSPSIIDTMAALTTRQSKMTKKERDLQERILNKYRTEGVIPAMIKIKSETGAALGTIAAFMTGNSANEPIRKYIKDRLTKNLEPLPADVVMLFAVWERDKPEKD